MHVYWEILIAAVAHHLFKVGQGNSAHTVRRQAHPCLVRPGEFGTQLFHSSEINRRIRLTEAKLKWIWRTAKTWPRIGHTKQRDAQANVLGRAYDFLRDQIWIFVRRTIRSVMQVMK